MTTSEASQTPPYTDVDFICEQGDNGNHHPGNPLLLDVESLLQYYVNAPRYDKNKTPEQNEGSKRSLVLRVIDAHEARGGRILKKVKGSATYIVITDLEERIAVVQPKFRDALKRIWNRLLRGNNVHPNPVNTEYNGESISLGRAILLRVDDDAFTLKAFVLGYQLAEWNYVKVQCREVLLAFLSHEDGQVVFNKPVDAVALGLPDYHEVIKRPMDLGTILEKFEDYRSFKEFECDVQLTFNNAILYNEEGNDVHTLAKEMKATFTIEIKNRFPWLQAEADAGSSQKKSAKGRCRKRKRGNDCPPDENSNVGCKQPSQHEGAHEDADLQTDVPERSDETFDSESTSEVNDSNPVGFPDAEPMEPCPLSEAVAAKSNEAFGQHSQTIATTDVPQREPQPTGGMPHLHVHRNTRTTDVRDQLIVKRMCLNVLKALQLHEHGWDFNEPVDPVKMKAKDYFDVKKDLGTIQKKVEDGCCGSLAEFESYVLRTFDNAMQYNPVGNAVHTMAKEMKDKFIVDYQNLIMDLEAFVTLESHFNRFIDNAMLNNQEGSLVYVMATKMKKEFAIKVLEAAEQPEGLSTNVPPTEQSGDPAVDRALKSTLPAALLGSTAFDGLDHTEADFFSWIDKRIQPVGLDGFDPTWISEDDSLCQQSLNEDHDNGHQSKHGESYGEDSEPNDDVMNVIVEKGLDAVPLDLENDSFLDDLSEA